MKIPKSFELLGLTVTVSFIPEGESPDSVCGYYDPTSETIYISSSLPLQTQEQTFLHEFLHAALQAMGRDKLNADEAFIDVLAGLVHQMDKSAKYA